MLWKFLLGISVILLLVGNVSASINISISDQGTSARDSGTIINNGNLTIEFWDSPTGGNLISQSNFTNVIHNGSWNVIINNTNLSLDMNRLYYKEYYINDIDIDFGNDERLEWYSPWGTVGPEDLLLDYYYNSSNISSTTWNRSGTNVFLVNTDDSVGIGTTNPQSKLEVNGTLNVTNITGRNTFIHVGNLGTTSHALSVDDDLFISGKLEVDGLSYFDSIVSFTESITITNNVTIGDGLTVANNATFGKLQSLDWSNITMSHIQVSDFNTTVDTIVGEANTTMKNYVDTQDTVFNNSLKGYTDAQNIVYNTTMTNYVNTANTTQLNWVDNFFVRFTELVAQIGNWTADKINYYTKTEVTTNITSANTSMKNYVDTQDIVFNDSMKAYVDTQDSGTDTNASTACNGTYVILNGENTCLDLNGQYINITEEGNLNVNNSNSTDYWDDIDSPDDFINITASGYINGQPINGSIGSGIISSASNKVSCGCVNVTASGGLNVTYHDATFRIVNLDGTTIYCDITGDTITVPDNKHSVFYMDNTCTLQNTTWTAYFDLALNPSDHKRFFDVFTSDGEIEVIKGGSIESLAHRKQKDILINCGSGGHLGICDGLDIEENTFSSINQTAGHFRYINSKTTSQKRTSEIDGIHIVHHTAGAWTHTNQTGLNITHCDNTTDLIECSNSLFRRYVVYNIGWGVNTGIHQLAPLDSETYTNLGNCLNTEENPISYTLPTNEDGVAIVHHIYCAKRDDTAWRDGWIDLRAGTNGFGATIDTSLFLTKDGTTPLTADWNQGAFNLTNTSSWWLGMIDWANIQNKFITAVNSAYFYMTGTTVFLNETSLNTTIDTIVGEANTTMKNYVDTQDTLYNTTLKAYVDTQDTAFNTSLKNYCDVQDTLYNTTLKAYLDTQDTVFNDSMKDYVIETNTSLKNYADTQDTTFNDTLKAYVDATNTSMKDYSDAQDTAFNDSLKAYCDAQDTIFNDSVKGYVDAQDTTYNDTLKAYIDSQDTLFNSTTFDTNASTACSGDTTYLDGEGNCDDISSVYAPVNYGDDWNKTYADTLYADISVTGDNTSWNQSYADTLYRPQSWDNITGIPHATPSDGDTTHFSLADEIYDWVISLAYATETYVDNLVSSVGNWSANVTNYYNYTQIDTNISTANTSMKGYVDTQNTVFNDSIKGYVDEANTSMKDYVDTQDVVYNTTMVNYVTLVNGTMKTYADEQNNLRILKTGDGMTGLLTTHNVEPISSGIYNLGSAVRMWNTTYTDKLNVSDYTNLTAHTDTLYSPIGNKGRINDSTNKTWADTESGYDSVFGVSDIQFGINGTSRMNMTYGNGLEVMGKNSSGNAVNVFVGQSPNTADGSGARLQLGNENSAMLWFEGIQHGVYGVAMLSLLQDVGGGTYTASPHWWFNSSGYAKTDLDWKFVVDSIGAIFGADDDAEIFWDGSDLNISTKTTAYPDGITLVSLASASMYIDGTGAGGALGMTPTNITQWTKNLNDTIFVEVSASTGAFVIRRDGKYDVRWDVSGMSQDVAGAPLYYTIEVNGVSYAGGKGSEWFGVQAEQENVKGSTEINLNVGDVVWLAIADGSGQNLDLLVEYANFNIERVGEII